MTVIDQQLTGDARGDVWLEVPAIDVSEPQVSIVIPALNEELTITDFVRLVPRRSAAAGVVGEIVIVDSSTDRTAELAIEAGARVLHTPKRGLGRAYIDALPFVRGRGSSWVTPTAPTTFAN